MGDTAFNDLTAASYWAFIALAICALAIAARGPWFKLCLAVLNIGFCVLIAGEQAAAVIVIVLGYLHISCRIEKARLRIVLVLISGILLGAVFLIHKMSGARWGTSVAPKHVLAAIGFSYIFLRCVEYLRAGASGATRGISFVETVNYLMPFHMLAAGPIQAFSDFRRSPAPMAALGPQEVLGATERIARGLFKKFVLANGLVKSVFLTDFKAGGAYFFIEVQMYYLFIYLDFSAYSDIAVGIGKLLGVRTPENFNMPLRARNIVMFWERWHMSLSQFIRRNVFIPIQLAGMRTTEERHPRLVTCVAVFGAFMACGLWHGVSFRFALWGIGHAMALILCILYRESLVARLGRAGADAFSAHPAVRVVATVLTFEFVAFSLAFLAHPAFDFLG